MGRYGTWRPLASNWASQPKMAKFDLVILHTMVGTLAGTDGMFKKNGFGGTFSHFGLGYDGTVYQWQDTAYRAAASMNANPRCISLEAADMGTGFPAWNTNDGNAVPAWTPKQVDKLVDFVAWACRTHDIPCAIVPDSKPTRRGIAWHRLGVPGYAVPGGELWSSARGKVCPGNRRIAQIPDIVNRARLILGGAAPTSTTTPTSKKQENEMRDYFFTGAGSRRIGCPVGKASEITAKAWVSLLVEGPATGSVRIFFQSDTGGISDVVLAAKFVNGRSERPWVGVPDGATQMNIQYNLPNGGTVLVETESK